MIKLFCDRCDKLISQNSPRDGVHVTPGYIGEKVICDGCWDAWKEVVNDFFYNHTPRVKKRTKKGFVTVLGE